MLVRYESKDRIKEFYIGEVVDFEHSDDEEKGKDLDIKFYRKSLKVSNAFVKP